MSGVEQQNMIVRDLFEGSCVGKVVQQFQRRENFSLFQVQPLALYLYEKVIWVYWGFGFVMVLLHRFVFSKFISEISSCHYPCQTMSPQCSLFCVWIYFSFQFSLFPIICLKIFLNPYSTINLVCEYYIKALSYNKIGNRTSSIRTIRYQSFHPYNFHLDFPSDLQLK